MSPGTVPPYPQVTGGYTGIPGGFSWLASPNAASGGPISPSSGVSPGGNAHYTRLAPASSTSSGLVFGGIPFTAPGDTGVRNLVFSNNNPPVTSALNASFASIPAATTPINATPFDSVPTNNLAVTPGQGTSPVILTNIPSGVPRRRLPISNRPLHYSNTTEALRDQTMGRKRFVLEEDDWQETKRDDNARRWIKQLVNAFGTDYLEGPTQPSRQSEQHKIWFKRWQKSGNRVAAILFHNKGQLYLERCCWAVFDAVIKIHELGTFTTDAQWQPNKTLKCSDRLARVVELIEQYALIRSDVLRGENNTITDLVANPDAAIKRKLVNCWNNFNRSYRNEKLRSNKALKGESEANEGDSAEEIDTKDDEVSGIQDDALKQESPLMTHSVGGDPSRLSLGQSLGAEYGMMGLSSAIARLPQKRARSTTPGGSEESIDTSPIARKCLRPLKPRV